MIISANHVSTKVEIEFRGYETEREQLRLLGWLLEHCTPSNRALHVFIYWKTRETSTKVGECYLTMSGVYKASRRR